MQPPRFSCGEMEEKCTGIVLSCQKGFHVLKGCCSCARSHLAPHTSHLLQNVAVWYPYPGVDAGLLIWCEMRHGMLNDAGCQAPWSAVLVASQCRNRSVVNITRSTQTLISAPRGECCIHEVKNVQNLCKVVEFICEECVLTHKDCDCHVTVM